MSFVITAWQFSVTVTAQLKEKKGGNCIREGEWDPDSIVGIHPSQEGVCMSSVF